MCRGKFGGIEGVYANCMNWCNGILLPPGHHKSSPDYSTYYLCSSELFFKETLAAKRNSNLILRYNYDYMHDLEHICLAIDLFSQKRLTSKF